MSILFALKTHFSPKMSAKKSKGKRTKGTLVSDITDCVALLPGRRQCVCEATKHELVANCLSCGRIVCQQEGPGECFTCGQLVLNIDERRAMMSEIEGRKAAKELSENLVKEEPVIENIVKNPLNTGLKGIAASFESNEDLDKAIRHKDRMLEFDRNSSVRTKVIDDENDYFSLESEKWISKEQRKTISSEVQGLHENKFKKDRKILIDLVERSASDYTEPVIKDFDQKIQNLVDKTQLKSDYEKVDTSSLIDESYQTLPDLVYINTKNKSKDLLLKDKNLTKNLVNNFSNLRIQDKELMELSDEGMCLSVNQPFASLLVCGIKRFEGRNWYSPFRGRLWIHTNSKKLDEKLVEEVENMYRYSGVNNFPSSYPLSALIGCVTVTECLPFEEYQQRFPNGDTEANYIFVCDDAKQIRDPVPIASGGHRIWKLNQSIHLLAKKQIEL